MVDRISAANQIPFSPLRNSSIGFIDDYESGMEASASSMAEEEDDEEEEEIKEKPVPFIPTKKRNVVLDYKVNKNSHRRMSSGNSSTDSNATVQDKRPLKTELSSPLVIHPLRLSRKEDLPTPSSGYDGDTEGPLAEDNNNN